jgi:hypothetical protein
LVFIKGINVKHICCSFCEEYLVGDICYLLHQAVCSSFFLDKKEAKKSRAKDVHPLRPAAMTNNCATVASAFINCYSTLLNKPFLLAEETGHKK